MNRVYRTVTVVNLRKEKQTFIGNHELTDLLFNQVLPEHLNS